METEIRHFVDELMKDDPYGYPWEQVVDEYLKSGYKENDVQYELTVLGSAYRVLKRKEVTVFYDEAGNTIFDVVNERLAKEYECMMSDTKSEESKEAIAGLPVPTPERIETAKVEDAKSVKQSAKEKLEKEMKADKDKTFAEPVIGYLLKRCEEDEGLAQDVVQEHKTWKKCFDYIYSQARKQTRGNCAAVRDDVVYEWAEDYYHKDDKAEEEKKAKKEAERKAKQKKEAEERKAKAKEKPAKTASVPQNKEEIPKEQPKPKRNGRDMDGQLDMFSMMGM